MGDNGTPSHGVLDVRIHLPYRLPHSCAADGRPDQLHLRRSTHVGVHGAHCERQQSHWTSQSELHAEMPTHTVLPILCDKYKSMRIQIFLFQRYMGIRNMENYFKNSNSTGIEPGTVSISGDLCIIWINVNAGIYTM